MVVIYWRMNTWCMVTVSEYGTLCLDYGPGAWSVSINRNEGEEGTRNHVFATAMTDRGGRQRPLVGNEAFRQPKPSLIAGQKPISQRLSRFHLS